MTRGNLNLFLVTLCYFLGLLNCEASLRGSQENTHSSNAKSAGTEACIPHLNEIVTTPNMGDLVLIKAAVKPMMKKKASKKSTKPSSRPISLEQQILDCQADRDQKYGIDANRKLGAGGFGSAYVACMGKDCNLAAKVIHLEPQNNETFEQNTKKFENEAEILRLLNTHNIATQYVVHFECEVPTIEVKEPSENQKNSVAHLLNQQYANFGVIVTSLHDGDLRGYLRKFKPSKSTIEVMSQELRANLKKMHDLKVIHGDVKLENIFYSHLNGSDKVFFGDFGQAKKFMNSENISVQEAKEFATKAQVDIENLNSLIAELEKAAAE